MEKSKKDSLAWKTLSSEVIISRPPWHTSGQGAASRRAGESGVLRARIPRLGQCDCDHRRWEVRDGASVSPGSRRDVRRDLRRSHGEGGGLEEGEDPEAAARRELQEETGYVGGTWRKLMTISGNPSTTDNLTHCFVAEGVHDSGLRHLDSTEDIEVELMTEAELYDLLLRDRIRQSLMAAPLWRWFATRKD